jgi:hypothetical protein
MVTAKNKIIYSQKRFVGLVWFCVGYCKTPSTQIKNRPLTQMVSNFTKKIFLNPNFFLHIIEEWVFGGDGRGDGQMTPHGCPTLLTPMLKI